jgi:glycosyltransferase involved in cell wall biosynthesis
VTVACSSVERLVRETTESRISPQILAWGIDPTVFPAGEPAQRRPELTVLHVGSLHPVKGQSSLLRAFALVRAREPAARLVIAGDGPLRMPLQRLAHELSVGEAVEFLGHVPRERLGALYRSAHVLAVSSAYESQHVATLEAGLHSLPVVSTEVGLPADLAREGVVIAVPVDQPEATADALLRLREPRLAVPMGDRLRQAVQRRFLAGQTARRLLDLYAGQGCEG